MKNSTTTTQAHKPRPQLSKKQVPHLVQPLHTHDVIAVLGRLDGGRDVDKIADDHLGASALHNRLELLLALLKLKLIYAFASRSRSFGYSPLSLQSQRVHIE